MAEKRRGLGRGLGALIPSGPAPGESTSGPARLPRAEEQETRETAAADLGGSPPGNAQRGTKLSTPGETGPKPEGTKSTEALGNVSRETFAGAPGRQHKNTSPPRNRRDMGQALRNTTTVRRPVDMFFLPSEEAASESGSGSRPDPTGTDEVKVSRETPTDAPSGTVPDAPVSSPSERGLPPHPGVPLDLPVEREPTPGDRSVGKTPGNSTSDIAPGAEGTTTEPAAAKNAPAGDVSRETHRPAPSGAGPEDLNTVPGARFVELPVRAIHPNRKQPRQVFDEDELAELAFSVRELGVLQPVVVRPSREADGAGYELVMGERRWRAVQEAGLATIPAIVRETADDDLLRDALLENLHRTQLNPLEEAAAYQQLMEEFGTTQEELSGRIGRSRPQISNTLRLLRLPALVQRRVAAGVLSSGHARALLGLTDPSDIERLAQRIVAEGLSVRATEEAVALHDGKRPAPARRPAARRHDDRLGYIADAFSDKLDTSVKIQLGARKGKMTIEFASVDDLNRIIDVLDPKLEEKGS